YRKIYEVLTIENKLPSPYQIYILQNHEVENVRQTVFGFAIPPDKLWFRNMPPDYITFAHELIHLIEKDRSIEEVYGYNLASFIVLLAKHNIKPKVNPLRIFDVDEIRILKAIEEVYRYKFDSVDDFFVFKGVIPSYMRVEETEKGIVFVRDPAVDQKTVVILTISELIAGAEYEHYMFQVLLKLLDSL
ncbi:MAG: hypothetical protein B9J98_08120, partial [Candidatus Terraquivivens tikiterensis]